LGIKVLKISKDILWISGGQVVGLVNNFLLLKILTANLSVTAYGYYALWMSAMLFIRQILYDPISIIAAKESIRENFLEMNGFTSLQIVRYVTDRLFFILFFAAVLIVFIESVFYEKVSMGGYALLGVIYIASNGAQGIYINIFNTIQKRKWAAVGISADSFVKLCLVSIAFLIIAISLDAAISAVAISSLLVFIWIRSISNHFFYQDVITVGSKFIATKKLIMLSLPFFVPTLLMALKGIGDKVFMATLISVEDLAAYNVLLQLGFIPMMLIIGVIQTYVGPDIYRLATHRDANQTKIIRYLSLIVLKIAFMLIIATITSVFFSENIFKILVGADYIGYSKFLPYFVIAGAIAGISGLLNVAVIGVFSPQIVGALMSFSIFLGILILMMAMSIYGFEGGIFGLIISNLVMMFVFMSSLWLIPFAKQGN
jgi:O-antigen/teichoic acid export membrane protein